MMRLAIGVIYKITYPNGKIYIGQDRTNDINYFGSADSFTIAADFSEKERLDFTVRKEILLTLRNCTIQELNAKERELIFKHQSHQPKIGYNRTRQARKKCMTIFAEKGKSHESSECHGIARDEPRGPVPKRRIH